MPLIEADSLWKTFENAGWWDNADRDIAQDLLDQAPLVDAEPVRHGQWETKEYTTEDSFDDWIVIHHEEVCSECGKGQGERSKFCPNCGAKMDGGKQDAAD